MITLLLLFSKFLVTFSSGKFFQKNFRGIWTFRDCITVKLSRVVGLSNFKRLFSVGLYVSGFFPQGFNCGIKKTLVTCAQVGLVKQKNNNFKKDIFQKRSFRSTVHLYDDYVSKSFVVFRLGRIVISFFIALFSSFFLEYLPDDLRYRR